MKNRKIITAVLIGVVIIFGGLGIASSGEKIQASSIKEFIAEYGGFGIKGEWETLGTASAKMIFENGGGSGWIMLGENKYLVAVLIQHVIEREGENSVIYEGNLIENECIVRFAIYKDVMVGEIEVEGLIYSFGVAQTLDSARYVLDQYNEHLQEEIEPLPFEDLIVPDDRLVIPAIVDIDPDTLNLKSKGRWVTAYIELPPHPELPEFDVTQIDVNTVKLNDRIFAENDPKYGFVKDPNSYLIDHDKNGLLERIVKFNRVAVQDILELGDRVKIEVTGLLFDARPFYDLDWIKVIGEKTEKLPTTTLEGYSNDFREGTEISEEFLAELVSEDQGFAEPELPGEASIPGKTEGVGTYFEIKDSEYLNITLKSTEEIKVVLESIPRMISIDISSSTDFTSTNLIINGLELNKTYYKYQDSYKNEAVFIADEKGSYSWPQDLSQPHHIWLQEIKGTVFLPGDCSTYGNWDETTQTCTLTQDLTESVEIEVNNVKLDCNGHSIIGTEGTSGYGIYLWYKEGIAIKNCVMSNFHSAIYFTGSNNNNIMDNNFNNNIYGIYLYASNKNTLINNSLSNNWIGISLLHYSSSNTLVKNILSNNYDLGIHVFYNSNNNTIRDNNISGGGRDGIYLHYSTSNTLTGNKMTGNKYNFGLDGGSDIDFDNLIDTSNTVDGKPIYYILNAYNQVYDSSTNAGTFYCIKCNNITLRDLALTKNSFGVFLYKTQDSKVENISSSYNWYGTKLLNSNNNTLINNDFLNNEFPIFLYYSGNNKIYHNNFINNTYQPYAYPTFHFFDNGYPSGGNYWSDYTGKDLKSGPNQDQPGSDGIGDMRYLLLGGQDRYPFMRESGWEVSRERIVSVYAVADEEYIGYYDNWWNPWDENQWISEMIKAVELGDNAFEEEFQINFVVKDIDFWDSDDATDDLDELFDEVKTEIDKGTNDIMVAFTGQLNWLTTPYHGLVEGEELCTEKPILGDDVIVVRVPSFWADNVHQHEYSHLFGAPDHDRCGEEGIRCIMTYNWAYKINEWCSDCYSKIMANKWREF